MMWNSLDDMNGLFGSRLGRSREKVSKTAEVVSRCYSLSRLELT